MSYYNNTARTQVHRYPERASYERETVWGVLDEGLVAHVGVATSSGPVVLPMIYARKGDTLYLHGSPASGLLRRAAEAQRACATVTLVDGLVLARSPFHHSLNYRSAVVFGPVRVVTDATEKQEALDLVVDHMAPGRGAEVRQSTRHELASTRVVALEIEEASAKRRSGPPLDDEADLGQALWAGVLPLRLLPGSPERSADVPEGVEPPPAVARWGRPVPGS